MPLYSNAQTGRWTHQIGIEVGPQIPFDIQSSNIRQSVGGSLKNATDMKIGYGGALNYYYQIQSALFFQVSLGFGYFPLGKPTFVASGSPVTYDLSNTALLNIPITAGVRYNFATSGFQPYVGLEIGYYFNSWTNGTVPTIATLTPNNFAMTPKAGIRYPIQPGLDFDASAKFMYLFSSDLPFAYLGINVGVSYALNFK